MASVHLRDHYTPQFKTLDKSEEDELEFHHKSLKRERECFTDNLLTNLKHVDTNHYDLKKAISLTINNFGIHYFKDVIKSINERLDQNDNILNLKQKELTEKEKFLGNDLKQIEQRIFDMSIGRTNSFKTQFLSYKPLKTHHVSLPESVCLFDDFLLKTGGHSGGWKPEDHQLFLQLKSKHTPDQVAELLHQKFPDISIDKVQEHHMWHEKYIKLLQDKKLTVQDWKSSKKSGRSLSVGNIEDIINQDTSQSRPSTERGSKCKKSDENIKKQIAEWKLSKSFQVKEDEERKKREEERRQALEKEKKLIKMAEKQKILQYIHSKQEAHIQEKEEIKNMREEDQRNKSRKANILIQVYRKQDEKRIQEKLERKEQSVLKELETQERLRRVKSAVNVGRDPERVRKATCVWKNKVFGEQEERGEGVTFINHVPHLKVPEWRHDMILQDQIIL